MNIGFIYYTFFPVSGGASVHGYNLAKELNALGYSLHKINGDADPYTKKHKNPLKGMFWILSNCDLIYIRMDYFVNPRNLAALFAILSRKKVIVEINSPSDELHLFGRGKKYIEMAEKIMSALLKRTDAVVTVSEPLKRFCTESLKLDHVHVIENGAEIFEDTEIKATPFVKKKLSEIRKKFSKIVVWSGSANEMQDLSTIREITNAEPDDVAFLLIVKEETAGTNLSLQNDHVFVLKGLAREDVKYLITHADIGLAFYSEYPWSRWGFYNSSLKIFEYLNNGLLTITNTKGTDIQQAYPNFRSVSAPNEVIGLIQEYVPQTYDYTDARTWTDVAQETSEIIQQVVNA